MQKILIFTSLLFLFIVSCRPKDDFKPIGEPFDQVLGLKGTFKLAKVEQVDELTSSLTKTLDVSDYCVGDNPMTLSFTIDTPHTVTINPGNSADFLSGGASSLTWAYDRDDAPSYLTLSNGTQWSLLKPIREFDKQLFLKLVKYYTTDDNGNPKATITYQFTFDRI